MVDAAVLIGGVLKRGADRSAVVIAPRRSV
jgi:hypothetical protein